MATHIAIVGISVDLPSGSYSNSNLDHEAFYEFLMNRGESYERIPADRLNIDSWKGNSLAEIHVDQGSFLKDIDQFDNVEFGISARDAKFMAPAVRKLMENCFLALLDSGIDYRARNVGCFTSATAWDLLSVTDADEYEARGAFSSAPAMVANRISNHLDLLGPSLPTDTACSSTLTALHLGVQALLTGDCSAAVVGGCQLNTRFIDWLVYSQGGILSKDGKCKPFDASADGFGRAEGSAAIVIKPLNAALRDHDRIYATILGTAINSTGGGAPPAAPVAEYQRDAMFHAFERAQRDPKQVDYVEAHVTGTAKGDPTEVNWIGENFKREDELLVGSVKGNIGHTEITAFLASLSKVLSTFKHGVIPPNVNLKQRNPAIRWNEYRLHVPVEPTKLPCRNGRPLVGIASSGIGGSNGHVVLEAPAPPMPLRNGDDATLSGPVLLMACGLSPRSAEQIADDVKSLAVREGSDIFALSTVLGRRAKQLTWRSFAVVDAEASHQLSPAFSKPRLCARVSPPIVMVFSGQGPQHKDMGRALFDTFPVFRNSILEMDAVYKSVTEKSLLEDFGLFSGEPSQELSDVWPIFAILPSIAVFQIALFDLLVSLGIKPNVLIGHSAGETAVLYASGAAPKALAVELAILRGTCFTALEDMEATMAALSCGHAAASEMIAEYVAEGGDGVVEIACYNSRSAVAIAGHNRAIDRVLELAHGRDIFTRKIKTRVPIHSSLMEACRDEYRSGLKALWEKYAPSEIPQIPTYSTLTGERFEGPFDADYFWRNTRGQVHFTQAMSSLSRTSPDFIFIENAPHPVLSAYVSSMASESSSAFAAVRRAKPGKPLSDHSDILTLCGNVTCAGSNCVKFEELTGRACYELETVLPQYPFAKKQFQLYPDTPGAQKQFEPKLGPLNHKHLKVNKETHPTLAQHVIRGEPIMPAAAYVEMALEFGASSLMHVNLRSILSLSFESPVKVNVALDGAHWRVRSQVPIVRGSNGLPTNMLETLHADGYLSFEAPPQREPLDLAAIRDRCKIFVDIDLYPSLSHFSAYGPRLQRVTNAYLGAGEALVFVKGLDETLSREGNYVLHPAILDACFHIVTYRPFHGDFNPNIYYLPASMETLVLHQSAKPKYFPKHVYAHITMTGWTPDAMLYDIELADDAGGCLCSVREFKMAKHRINPLPDVSRPLDVVLEPIASLRKELELGDAQPVEDVRIEINQQLSLSSEREEFSSSDGDAREGLKRIALRIGQTLKDSMDLLAPRKRVIRVLILGSTNTVLKETKRIVSEFPAHLFELFVGTTSRAQFLSQALPNAVVRAIDERVLASETSKHKERFDLLILMDPVLPELSFKEVMTRCDTLLQRRGVLILTQPILKAWVNDTSASLKAAVGSMQHARLSILSAHCIDSGSDTCLIAAGRKDDAGDFGAPLFSSSSNTIFDYSCGAELQLREKLQGLDVSMETTFWVLASEGQDGASAMGLLRALRREYRSWTFRLVIFPTSYTPEKRLDILRQLPIHLHDELEIVITSSGEAVAPRLLPLPPLETPAASDAATVPNPPHDHQLQVSLLNIATEDALCGFVAEVREGRHTNITVGAHVVGLTTASPNHCFLVDADAVMPITVPMAKVGRIVASCLVGFTAAVLATGPSTFSLSHRSRSLRILVTHYDSAVGKDIAFAYKAIGAVPEVISREATLIDFAGLPQGSFDVIVSSYTDKAYRQLLQPLLKPRKGKIFFWNDPVTGLLAIQDQDPCFFGDALRCALTVIQENITRLSQRPRAQSSSTLARATSTVFAPSTLFDPDKAYVLLGGIGSLGVQIALMMYERGARNLVLTSRSGARSLQKNPITMKMVDYLQTRDDLSLRLEAVDATSNKDMRNLFWSIDRPVGGCIILTAVLSDALFDHLKLSDFFTSFAAKVGVMNTLEDVIDPSDLDFLIAFSSMSALVGLEGQANYDAANTALEQAIEAFDNAFSFICPGILDSSMMSTDDGRNFDHLAEWAMSAEDMLCWLEDSIKRHKSGQHFKRYVPDHNWEALDRNLGMPKLGKHIVPTWSDAAPSTESKSDGIAEAVQKVVGLPLVDISPEVPLTTYGLDSLSASRLAFALRSLVEVSQIQLLANMSLQDLQNKAASFIGESVIGKEVSTRERSRAELMLEMLAKYADDLKRLPDVGHPTRAPATEPIILVTGTTGALGAHTLARLLTLNQTKRVYAFNRPSTVGVALRDRQATALASQGLSSDLVDSPKLVLVEGDLPAPDLGLPEDLFQELLGSVTHVIHNAWRVDFGTPLSGFEDLIRGTRHLLDFCARSPLPTPPSLSFISTIAVYLNTDGAAEAPESPILDPNVAASSGYMESKWVAERLVQIAAERSVARTNVVRVGLLSGAQNGSWDTTHWMPALVQTAVPVGCLPDGNDIITWMNMETAAAAIVDLRDTVNETLHVVHPRPVTWDTVIRPIASQLNVPLVPYREWLARLQSLVLDSAEVPGGSQQIDALKLLDIYRLGVKQFYPRRLTATESMGILPKVASAKAVRASATLADAGLRQVSGEDAERWLAHWHSVGYLPSP